MDSVRLALFGIFDGLYHNGTTKDIEKSITHFIENFDASMEIRGNDYFLRNLIFESMFKPHIPESAVPFLDKMNDVIWSHSGYSDSSESFAFVRDIRYLISGFDLIKSIALAGLYYKVDTVKFRLIDPEILTIDEFLSIIKDSGAKDAYMFHEIMIGTIDARELEDSEIPKFINFLSFYQYSELDNILTGLDEELRLKTITIREESLDLEIREKFDGNSCVFSKGDDAVCKTLEDAMKANHLYCFIHYYKYAEDVYSLINKYDDFPSKILDWFLGKWGCRSLYVFMRIYSTAFKTRDREKFDVIMRHLENYRIFASAHQYWHSEYNLIEDTFKYALECKDLYMFKHMWNLFSSATPPIKFTYSLEYDKTSKEIEEFLLTTDFYD